MAEVSGISWTDATFNPWIGCTKVSPACDNCYAARDNKQRKWVPAWGEIGQPSTPRKRTSEQNWHNPLRWNRKAAITGYRPRVFCASLADVFDNEVEQKWRDDLWQLLRETPNLRWILLTKRIGNAPKMLPADWPFANAGLMATLENQTVWDRDYRKLAAIPAAWHGVSAEPLLGPIDIGDAKPDWIDRRRERSRIPAARLGRGPELARSVRAERYYVQDKQNGGFRGKDAGCLVDGVEHKFFPPALAA